MRVLGAPMTRRKKPVLVASACVEISRKRPVSSKAVTRGKQYFREAVKAAGKTICEYLRSGQKDTPAGVVPAGALFSFWVALYFSGGRPVRDGGRPFLSSGPSYSVRSMCVRRRPVSGTSL